MAQAVTRLWPGAHYAIGPAIRDGFYYDFELPDGERFCDDDLERIDAEMRAIIAEDQPFTRHEYSIDEGLALFADQPFKREIIRRSQGGGDAEDLAEVGGQRRVDLLRTRPSSPTCAGVPTCPRPGASGAFA